MSKLDRREVFFALIAPIGVNLDKVESALASELKTVGYDSNPIRLTSIFDEFEHSYDTKTTDAYNRYEKLIKAGDQLCKDTGRNDIFALYGIHSLAKKFKRGPGHEIPSSIAHIFRQVKRFEEIQYLKEVFGRNIILLGCYSSKNDRINNLVQKLLMTSRGLNRDLLKAQALTIMSTDEDEKDNPNGQRVIDCYPHADYIVDCTDHTTLNKSIERMVKIYFGYPFISPTKDEYCSYFANAASYRSLDLSRQVGAAIFADNCEVISLGCNEVPKAGGGTYWSDDGFDGRDFAMGRDSNQQVREHMAIDALVRLQKDWLAPKFKELDPKDLSFRAFDAPKAPLKDSMLNDVIEYGRMVHAEMNAITDAARTRKSTDGCTLYCTTMPCHLCTKLIIASGISRVVYMQPYSKSLVSELYPDSVSIDEFPNKNQISFHTLRGVTPNGYRIAFRKTGKRKNKDGSPVVWQPLESLPTFVTHFAQYQHMELNASKELFDLLKKVPKPNSDEPVPKGNNGTTLHPN